MYNVNFTFGTVILTHTRAGLCAALTNMLTVQLDIILQKAFPGPIHMYIV